VTKPSDPPHWELSRKTPPASHDRYFPVVGRKREIKHLKLGESAVGQDLRGGIGE